MANNAQLYKDAEPVRIGVVLDDLAVNYLIHENRAVRYLLAGGRYAHEWSFMSACIGYAHGNHVPVGHLGVNGIAQVGKGRMEHRMALAGLVQTWVLLDGSPISPTERSQHLADDSLILFFRHGSCLQVFKHKVVGIVAAIIAVE